MAVMMAIRLSTLPQVFSPIKALYDFYQKMTNLNILW